MRILHVDNLMIRYFGWSSPSSGRSLLFGSIRNGWRMCEFSDRDIARFEAPLGIRPLGRWQANRRLIETCDNFRPDLLIFGHCDIIRNATLQEIRRNLPGVRIAHWNHDALWVPSNIASLHARMPHVDALFVTTGGQALREFCTGRNVVAYMPNPVDPALEDQDNSRKTIFDRDVVFCGVGETSDDRYALLARLRTLLPPGVRLEWFGMLGRPPVWAAQYDAVLAGSRMGLNLNRFEGWPLYSSDRIAQLMGNGVLTFLADQSGMRRFFSDEQVVYFTDVDSLARRIVEFGADDARRQAVATAGRAYYHKHFSSQQVMRFIAETALGLPYSQNYLWADEVYR